MRISIARWALRFVTILMLLMELSLSAADADPPKRPLLNVRQGQYFRYALPPQWSAQESRNGVDLMAPDRYSGAFFSILVGGFAQNMTPRIYLQMLLQRLGHTDARYLELRDLPHQPAFGSFFWQSIVADLGYAYNGRLVRAQVTVGVIQGFGQYTAAVRGHQAPPEIWDQSRMWLPMVEQSVVITDPVNVAGISSMALPRNISHDEIYGQYNSAWQQRRHSADHLSRARHEATLGYERMKDPQTGQLYDMPLEHYDPSRGGYVNPHRPTEILVPAQPGE